MVCSVGLAGACLRWLWAKCPEPCVLQWRSTAQVQTSYAPLDSLGFLVLPSVMAISLFDFGLNKYTQVNIYGCLKVSDSDNMACCWRVQLSCLLSYSFASHIYKVCNSREPNLNQNILSFLLLLHIPTFEPVNVAQLVTMSPSLFEIICSQY